MCLLLSVSLLLDNWLNDLLLLIRNFSISPRLGLNKEIHVIMRSTIKKDRPKYIDLSRIKLPITGVVSIAHRVSGMFLVLSIPAWLYLLDLSLSSEAGYAEAVAITDSFMFTLLAIIAFWALAHHFFAGIRFLLFDIDIGVEKETAIKAAKAVFVAEGVLILVIIGWLL